MDTVEPIRDRRDVEAIKRYLWDKNEKYYIMFLTGIYLGLRINEILSMTVEDVKGKKTKRIRQKKTGKEIVVAYNPELQRAYKSYCENRAPGEALVPNPYNEYKSITRGMAYLVLNEAAQAIGLQNIGTHSMRKTCGYHYYQQTHDIATLQVWFNHRHVSDTLRYIGVTSDSVQNAMINFKI